MERTREELEAEVARLREQLEHARAAARAQLQGTIVAGGSGSSTGTVTGLEEMTLLVDDANAIHFVNGPMARLLAIPDRRAALGTPLSVWDRGAIGEGVFATLVDVARASAGSHALERACPGLDPGRLPRGSGTRPAGDPVLRFVATATTARVQVVVQDVTRLRWLERTFSRYVPRNIIEQMQVLDAARYLATERREVTVLFGDLRGFTAITQAHEPDVVREMVNSFLGNMVECIEALDGTIEGFLGDGFMAIFGAPVEQPDHALRALTCAAEMLRRHATWMAEREGSGAPQRPLALGVGTGPLLVGNIGTPDRLHYTAMGHTTNLTSRLCTRAEGGEILTIPATHAAAQAAIPRYGGRLPVPRFSFRARGRMEFKNVAEPVDVLEVLVAP